MILVELTPPPTPIVFASMRNVPGRIWQGHAVTVNGPALRLIRQLVGLNCAQLAEEVGRSADYLRKIETGHLRTVSPEVFRALCDRLHIEDVRALLASPFRDEDDEVVAQLHRSTEDEAVRAV